MGGEKSSFASMLWAVWGSPPHGRGKDGEFVRLVKPYRITPAWAGKSRTYTASCQFWEDHPRMGGEKQSD